MAVVKTAFLAAVSSLTCGCDPLPAIPVTSVAKALEDARRQGRAFRATSVEVELSVAYGVKGGVEVPVALPINFGGEYSAATKMKFVLADLSQDVTGPLELLGKDKLDEETLGGVFMFDPNKGTLTPVK
ncbi:MAG TPA: hypothetical protein VK081_01175 [Planctomycetota bacterium]|nr:hypothetical protein [Planctomycetota bacterium]